MIKISEMTLVRTGDWDLVLNMTEHMSADILQSNRIVLAQLAARAEAMAVKHLQAQDLSWSPLSKKYLEQKMKKGLSPKIMIATSTYMQAITSQVKPNQSFAGVFRKSKEKNGSNVVDIAKLMEYGSVKLGIPARPLWKIVYAEMHKFIVREKVFARAAVGAMKKRTGGRG